jgi:hypothetical protein
MTAHLMRTDVNGHDYVNQEMGEKAACGLEETG